LKRVELLKADDMTSRVLHEKDFIRSFLADVFLVPVAEPDGESLSFAVVE
jgi:hypothetical protein